ncbi:hypothetical protein GCM10010399_26150 [Dactylosporangium fulvum]|uniref:Uncharacterized protein n=1 Tax=Dactylosporangium fulvum TaxID=53359 RepID=A0ABY5WBK3_9ACTN|nr:hypothetical protein [Dactylosporangium fulvum]UWP86907.1 hypothetical protein Dfulv_22750 [Dactylosporangium fulvum]
MLSDSFRAQRWSCPRRTTSVRHVVDADASGSCRTGQGANTCQARPNGTSTRQATALAAAISDTIPIAPEIARLQGIALAGVFQIIISESGRRTREGQTPAEIADALRPEIENILAELDCWLTR